MKKLNKKGFTLIELMAVVIVLIVVIFIAVNRINESTRKSKEKTLLANAISYVKAADNLTNEARLSDPSLKNGFFSPSDLVTQGLRMSGTKPNDGKILVSNYEVEYACLIYGKNKVIYSQGEYEISKGTACTGFDITYEYTGEVQEFVVPVSGFYRIQLWGAKGGYGSDGTNYNGGKGAYTVGTIELIAGTKLYVNVGGAGEDHISNGRSLCKGGFNGGGAGGQDNGNNDSGGGGGGATDIALVYSDITYDETNMVYTRSQASYASRIMVAAGGGGGAWNQISPGTGVHGGKLSVVNLITYRGGTSRNNTKGSQTDGYAFGYGESGPFMVTGEAKGGGGGGYYSGYYTDNGGQGAGGTSYISGYTGCVAVKGENDTTPKTGCADGTTNNACSIHYSGLKFTSARMVAGNGSMPKTTGRGNMTGNDDNGFAKITFIKSSNNTAPVPTPGQEMNFYEAFPDYNKTEYIESHGTEIISTFYQIDENSGFDITFNVSTPINNSTKYIISAGSDYYLSTSNNNASWAGTFKFNNQSYNAHITSNQKINVKYKNNSLITNNGTTYISNNSSLNASTLDIFGDHMDYSYNSSMKLYNLYLYDGNEVIAHFIPCYHKKTGEIGLCDTYDGSFNNNVGEGTFSKGNDV